MTTNEKEPTMAAPEPDEMFDRADHEKAVDAEAALLTQVQVQHLVNRAAYLSLRCSKLEAEVAELRTQIETTEGD